MYDTNYATVYSTQSELYDEINKIEDKINKVVKYRDSNPGCDPNTFELNEILFDVASIGSGSRRFEGEGKDEAYKFLHDPKYRELEDSFKTIFEPCMEQLAPSENGLITSKDDPLYRYFEGSFQRRGTLNSLGNHELRYIYSKACGINLFIKQNLRDFKNNGVEGIIYDNKQEYIDLLDRIEEFKSKDYSEEQLKPLSPLMEDIHMAIGKTPKEYYQALELKRQQEYEEKVMQKIREKQEQDKRKKDDPDDPII